jgi:hypothetical protein
MNIPEAVGMSGAEAATFALKLIWHSPLTELPKAAYIAFIT